jgi:hypothetical protein
MPAPVRKPVYDLTLADFDAAPVWEFALDEEGVAGQDEATVRPTRSRSRSMLLDMAGWLLRCSTG